MKTFTPMIVALFTFLAPMVAAECETGKYYCYDSLGKEGRQYAMGEVAQRNNEQYWNRSDLKEFTNECDWMFKCVLSQVEFVELHKRCDKGMCIAGDGSDGTGRTFDACIPAHINVDRESIREATEEKIRQRFAQ